MPAREQNADITRAMSGGKKISVVTPDTGKNIEKTSMIWNYSIKGERGKHICMLPGHAMSEQQLRSCKEGLYKPFRRPLAALKIMFYTRKFFLL